MGQTIAQKIIAAHLVDGKREPGCEVGLRIDQTLTQDATGTMAYLEYEAMGIPRVDVYKRQRHHQQVQLCNACGLQVRHQPVRCFPLACVDECECAVLFQQNSVSLDVYKRQRPV